MPAPTPSSSCTEIRKNGLCQAVYSKPRSGSTAKPARKSGLRPQASALRPTRIAIGTITACAAMMHADMNSDPSFMSSLASSWPTRGSIARVGEVEERHAGGEDQQWPAPEQHAEAGRPLRVVIVARQAASPRMVDGSPVDRRHREDAADRH